MRKYLNLILLIGVLTVIGIACQKETSNTNKGTEFNTAAAKEWWYGSYRKSADYKEINWASIFAPSPGSSTKKYPNWNKAMGYKKFSFEIVEIPLFYQTNEILLPGMQYLNKTKEGERVARASTHKLLLIKKANGNVIVRTVTIVPTAGYAAKNNYDISNVHPNNLPSDFEGYVMIAGWDETEKNTIKIEKGKAVRKVKLLTRQQMVKMKSNKTESLICPDPVWVSRMRFSCVVVPTGDAVADQEACEDNGEWIDYGGYEYPPCYDEEDPDDPNDPEILDDCLNSGMSTEQCFCMLYNTGCEDGDDDEEEECLQTQAEIDAQIDGYASQMGQMTQKLSIITQSETSTQKTKKYPWKFFGTNSGFPGQGITFTSHESGIQQLGTDGYWRWQSFTHTNEVPSGGAILFDLAVHTITAVPEITNMAPVSSPPIDFNFSKASMRLHGAMKLTTNCAGFTVATRYPNFDITNSWFITE